MPKPDIPDMPPPLPPTPKVIMAPEAAAITPRDPNRRMRGLTTLAGAGLGRAPATGASLIGGASGGRISG